MRWCLLACALWAVLGPACGDDDSTAPDAATAADAAPPDASAADGMPADAGPPDAGDPTPGATCEHAIGLEGDPIEVTGDTSTFVDSAWATCSPDSSGSPDAEYLLALGDEPVDVRLRVAVDETGDAPFDVVLSARTTCGDQRTELGCADAGWGETLEVLAATGDLFVLVDGTGQFGGAASGSYTLTAARRSIVADTGDCDPAGVTSRCATDLRCSMGTCVADSAELACAEAVDLTAAIAGGGADVTASTFAFAPGHQRGSCASADLDADEAVFRFDWPATADFEASTDHPETTFDTYLYLRADACDGAEVGCHDDVDLAGFNLRSRLAVPSLPAGTYYLFVDGSSSGSATGAFRLTVN